MKRKAILPVSLFILVGCWNLNAQQVMPAGASDKGPDKGDIKSRSIELERIDRDAHKPDAKNQAQPGAASAARFEEVKQDFETLQRLQNDVITEYTTKKK